MQLHGCLVSTKYLRKMQHKKTLGQRMKLNYEFRAQTHLTRRTPVIIRIDGKAFHTLTKVMNLDRPFDTKFNDWMQETTRYLCEEIQGAKLGYTQSDEISILVTDYENLNSDAWFDYNVQKMVSISASMATYFFNEAMGTETSYMQDDGRCYPAMFDSRVFNVPKEEVNNYFVWRQQDWIKNSVQMLARKYYSHKQLHGKNRSDMHEMIHEKGDNWAKLADRWKNGVTFIKETFDTSDGGENERIRTNWDDIPNHIFSEEAWVMNDLIDLKDCPGPATG